MASLVSPARSCCLNMRFLSWSWVGLFCYARCLFCSSWRIRRAAWLITFERSFRVRYGWADWLRLEEPLMILRHLFVEHGPCFVQVPLVLRSSAAQILLLLVELCSYLHLFAVWPSASFCWPTSWLPILLHLIIHFHRLKSTWWISSESLELLFLYGFWSCSWLSAWYSIGFWSFQLPPML